MSVFWMLRCVVWWNFTEISEALMMEAVSTSVMLVNFNHTTQFNIPDDSHLLTCRCENPEISLVNI
jgi:hypothetical protein